MLICGTHTAQQVRTTYVLYQYVLYIYRRPTKLGEGNVYSCVCHYVGGGRSLYAWPLPSSVQDLVPPRLVDLLNLNLPVLLPPPNMFKFAQTDCWHLTEMPSCSMCY